MNKKILVLFSILAGCMGFLAGCGRQEGSVSGFQEPDKLSVVTTIYPMYDFVNQIAGDRVEVINLVPAGIEPHDFELSTGDMALIEEAQLFVYNGANMEHFVDKTLQAVTNKNLTIVETAKDLEIMREDNGELDPHTWLSISNAKKQCKVILDALVALDGQHEKYYQDNYEQYIQQLDELDALYRDELKGCSKDTIVVAHEAFGYLCEEYHLKQEAVEGLTADSEPDSARMKEIIDLCKEKDIRIIFFEELVSPKVANMIAEEAGADTRVLNPVEGLTPEQEEEGLDYIGLMKENLEALKEALK